MVDQHMKTWPLSRFAPAVYVAVAALYVFGATALWGGRIGMNLPLSVSPAYSQVTASVDSVELENARAGVTDGLIGLPDLLNPAASAPWCMNQARMPALRQGRALGTRPNHFAVHGLESQFARAYASESPGSPGDLPPDEVTLAAQIEHIREG